MASPAEIVQNALAGLGLVTLPEQRNLLSPIQLPGDHSTVCFANSSPDDYDQMVSVTDTAARMFGRRMRYPKYLMHNGISVLIRHLHPKFGWALANRIAVDGLDQLSNMQIQLYKSDEIHYVKTVYRTTSVIFLGEQVGKKRFLWSIMARVAFDDREPPTG